MRDKNAFNEAQFARSIVYINAIIYAIFIVISVVAYLFHTQTKFPLERVFFFYVSPIAAAGLLFCFFGWRFFAKTRYFVGAYLSSIPIYLGLLIICYFNGGISSEWYVFWFLSIVITGMMGFFAVYGHIALSIIFYALAALTAWRTHNWHFLGSWQRAITTVSTLVEGFWMAMLLKIIHGNKENLIRQLQVRDYQQRLVLSSIADAVIAVDATRRVLFLNPAAQDLTGWDERAALGVEYNTLFKLKDSKEGDLTDATDPLAIAITHQQPYKAEDFHFLNKKQQKIMLSISAAPSFDENHQVSGAVATFRDVSEDKMLERERSEFISTASHEMRTPVAAIEGYLSMATNPKLAQIDDKARGFLTKAHEAALHLGRLFQDLLTTSKIEDHGLAEHREVFDISQVVLKLVDEMDVIAQQKGLTLQGHIGDTAAAAGSLVVAPSYKVYADAGHVRDIITNLIDNAIKYTTQGSVDVTLRADANNVLISIADTGMGISKADQRHLFEKFYRANNSMTQTIGGTGLGLYIARNLIEHYGGRIWVDSEPGRGSIFSFTLPLVK